MLKHPPPKFHNKQARKRLEAVVQVQLHFIHIYGNENVEEQGE